MQDAELEDLQTRLSFQEKTLSDLNDVIVKQQNEIDILRNSYRQLRQLISELPDSNSASQTDDVPPHY